MNFVLLLFVFAAMKVVFFRILQKLFVKELDCALGERDGLIIFEHIGKKLIISFHFLRVAIPELLYRNAAHELFYVLIGKTRTLNTRRSTRGCYENGFLELPENLRIKLRSRHPFTFQVINHPHLLQNIVRKLRSSL